MATTEHTINDAIAELAAQTTIRVARLKCRAVRNYATACWNLGSRRPDILIAEPHTAPVVIETEVLPRSVQSKPKRYQD